MSKARIVDLFVEDRAHEAFLKPLVERVARQQSINVEIRPRSARGGHGRALAEFQAFQRAIRHISDPLPDLIVVGIDGNCTSFVKRREEILQKTKADFQDYVVVACPNPHIERWYLADLQAFQQVVGSRPTVTEDKCQRDFYKKLLVDSIRTASHPPTLGGIEFAKELVDAMDLYRAGKGDGSLKAFLDDLHAKLRALGK